MIVQCHVCKGLWAEDRMETETLCVRCEALEYLKKKGGENHKKAKSKEHGGEVLPLAGERESKTEALAGHQLMLEL